eukprot:1530528-Pyramimonas_sp.AAC.1
MRSRESWGSDRASLSHGDGLVCSAPAPLDGCFRKRPHTSPVMGRRGGALSNLCAASGGYYLATLCAKSFSISASAESRQRSRRGSLFMRSSIAKFASPA